MYIVEDNGGKHACQKRKDVTLRVRMEVTVTSSSRFSSLCSYSLYELFISLFLTLPHITFTLRLRAPELSGEDTYTQDTKDTHGDQLQLSLPPYTGVTTVSFSLSCGNNPITDGWEQIEPNIKRFSTEKKSKKVLQ